MLDIAQGDSSQTSRTFKLQEKVLNFNEARSIKGNVRLIENHRKTDSKEF